MSMEAMVGLKEWIGLSVVCDTLSAAKERIHGRLVSIGDGWIMLQPLQGHPILVFTSSLVSIQPEAQE